MPHTVDPRVQAAPSRLASANLASKGFGAPRTDRPRLATPNTERDIPLLQVLPRRKKPLCGPSGDALWGDREPQFTQAAQFAACSLASTPTTLCFCRISQAASPLPLAPNALIPDLIQVRMGL